EIMAINPTIHDETGGNGDVVLAGLGEKLGLQWNFKAAGHVKNLNLVFLDTGLGQIGGEGGTRLLDDVLMPARLNKGDAFGSRIGKAQRLGLIHGFFLSMLNNQNQGCRQTRARSYRAWICRSLSSGL